MDGDDTAPSTASSSRLRVVLVIAGALAVVALVLGIFAVVTRGPSTAADAWTSTGDELGLGSPSLQTCGELPPEVHVMEQRGITSLLIGTDRAGDTVHCLAVETEGGWNAITSYPDFEATGPVPSDGVLVRDDVLLGMDPETPETHFQHVLGGEIGSSVSGVVLQTAVGEVEATVSNGWFGAWWPAMHEEELGEPVTAVLTLTDGSSRTVELIGQKQH